MPYRRIIRSRRNRVYRRRPTIRRYARRSYARPIGHFIGY